MPVYEYLDCAVFSGSAIAGYKFNLMAVFQIYYCLSAVPSWQDIVTSLINNVYHFYSGFRVSAHEIPVWNFANALSNILINPVKKKSVYICGEKHEHEC